MKLYVHQLLIASYSLRRLILFGIRLPEKTLFSGSSILVVTPDLRRYWFKNFRVLMKLLKITITLVVFISCLNAESIPYFHYNGIYCGQLGGVWVPGRVGSRNRFKSYVRLIQEERKKLANNPSLTNIKKRAIRKKISRYRELQIIENTFCARGPL